MWNKSSIKYQLILILLIPFSGLIYITVSNINFSLEEYKNTEGSLENINNIAILSEGIELIGNERTLSNYSFFDNSKRKVFLENKQKTEDWFLRTHIKDTVISKNLKKLQSSIINLHENIDNKIETPVTSFIKYTNINESIINLIEREVINCRSSNVAILANNYLNFVLIKRAALLKRGVVLQTLIDKKKDNLLLEYYYDAKTFESKVNFRLMNFELDDVNKGLIQFKDSKELTDFNLNTYKVVENRYVLAPTIWWKESGEIINKIKELEKENLQYIQNYVNGEKQSALINVTVLISILLLFLIVTFVLLFKLVNRLSGSLKLMSSTIKKISQGKIIRNPTFSGNSEFVDISNSFSQLLDGMKEQFDLASKISSGHYGTKINLRSQNDTLNKSMNTMSLELKRMDKESSEINKMKESISAINYSVLESKDLEDFGKNLCQTLVEQTQGCQSNFYIINSSENKKQLNKIGGYADHKNTPKVIKMGEGLVGEVAKSGEQNCLNDLPNSYSYLSSSLGESPYFNVLITPISYKNTVIGVIEIGSLINFNENHKILLNTTSESIGSAIEVFIRNEELKASVNEINRKNSILQVQEEELRQSNEELNKQSMLLQQSEEELRNQASELEQTNAYLEEKGRELENKNHEVNIKNEELLIAQEELNVKADEIGQASKYKSEFLANMSHELRTPLNSILILSELLKENNLGNLTDPQIDNLSVINSSGKDLLNLITDILDISKIEAGKVEIYSEDSIVERIYSDMDGLFRAQMEKKNIEFITTISEDCPRILYTDIGKLEQILKNFLSNALKFTPENGKVSLRFSSSLDKNDFASEALAKLKSKEILSVYIEDNGIGISDENKKKLFQTFQQADSSTSRKYGGTGLGLFISKELAVLLGGEVKFESELSKGSIFSVHIPAKFQEGNLDRAESSSTADNNMGLNRVETVRPSDAVLDLSENLKDDRNLVSVDDKTILIIEDDVSFADVLLQLAHDNGFKAIVAYQGETGFQYAKKYKPKAIILDMKLPGIDGWTVLKWLKEDKELQHIPVHVMSGMNREKLAKEMGAFDFLIKPITTDKLKSAFESIDIQINNVFKKVLILEDDVSLNYSIKELIHNCDRNVICIQAHTFKEAENILMNDDIDCAIMDIGLPDSKKIANIASLRKISKNNEINIIVNTGQSLTDLEQLELQNSADGIVIKTSNVTERLKDELLLFLDTVETSNKKVTKTVQNLLGGEVLKDKNILIVDDDIRNIYALSSALTTKGASILTAFNGIEALEALEKNTSIDIVLMDIMMPEMDGFEATKKIRENPKWKNLPIIALTAKAMKGDREEILNAGASDYQSKPIDIQQLISLISIWVYK
ncbi:response regulator [Flavobacterium degerlachei]|jgi:signal transduction histidine kinase/CheY-like chemotaxis protein/methyl-accepting chemotaxis protein|uniref:histidine kinase n=1 Tax=Flavobacterium degerlachei TaxID=229203 RepID=A0A1H2U9N1_9FLAO|nr:response regulator [Flavobacterium degerlachei]SDW52598.1 Signal transduction histidine kinase [Flavobacterium degerlachei]